jgi:hypothetical protein
MKINQLFFNQRDGAQFRKKKGISVEGEAVPHPVGSFCVHFSFFLNQFHFKK